MIKKIEIQRLRDCPMRMHTMIWVTYKELCKGKWHCTVVRSPNNLHLGPNTSDQHSNTMRKLNAVNQSYKDFEIKFDLKLDRIRDDVIIAVKTSLDPTKRT